MWKPADTNASQMKRSAALDTITQHQPPRTTTVTTSRLIFSTSFRSVVVIRDIRTCLWYPINRLFHRFRYKRLQSHNNSMVPLYCKMHHFTTLPHLRWHNGQSTGLAINRLWVQILLGQKLRNNLGQIVHTYVPLSSSSITWYRPRGGDALWLGR